MFILADIDPRYARFYIRELKRADETVRNDIALRPSGYPCIARDLIDEDREGPCYIALDCPLDMALLLAEKE